MVSALPGALAHYRSLPRIGSGSWMILAVGARAPYAMIPLGVLTALTASSGSVATGGLATGLVSIAAAVAGPLIGRAADLAGQRLVLGVLTPLNAVFLTLLLIAALQGWDGPGLWVICVATGATAIPVGSFARVRWVELARDPRDLRTALSYESTVDELSFVLGPALVGVAASTVLPAAPLALAAFLVAVAGIPFALFRAGPRDATPAQERTSRPAPDPDPAPSPQPRTVTGEIPAIGAVPAETPMPEDPPVVPGGPRGARPVSAAPPIPRVLLAVLPSIIVMVCIGGFFGSVQAATTERAALLGSAGSAGLVYALMGLGSALTALLVVLLPESIGLASRILAGGLGMGVLITFTGIVGGLGSTAVLLLVAGLFVGPTMVTAFALTDRRTPTGGTGVAMTSMQSSVTVGQAAGAGLGGALAAALGPAGAFGIGTAVSAVIAAVGASALLSRGSRARWRRR